MTVGELIEKLRKYPLDTEVVTCDSEDGWEGLHLVTLVDVCRWKNEELGKGMYYTEKGEKYRSDGLEVVREAVYLR